MNEKLDCKFSLLDEGRKFSGNHRKYLIENARDICYSDKTREKIRLREALGYYGHGRRQLCGKMDVGEVDIMTMPDGSTALVSNIPSNVTTKFDVAQDGTVSHCQEILDTETGRIVSGLNKSRIGGFSWACPGTDGGTKKATVLSDFSGFDYVLKPGFSANRGYVLESAEGTESMILESVAAVVGSDRKAEQIVRGWRATCEEDLESALSEACGQVYALQSKTRQMQKDLAHQILESAKLKEDHKTAQKKLKGILECFREHLPFFIPDEAMHKMLEGDFDRARKIFEDAQHYDTSHLPLPGTKFNGVRVEDIRLKDENEYGTADYGFDLM